MATSFSPILKKAIGCRTLLSGSLRKGDRPDFAAPLLHLRELSSGRDNLRLLFSRSIELFEIGDDIVNLLRVFQAWKNHFGAGYLGLRILDVFAESGFIPGDPGIFVRRRIAEALNRSSLSSEQPVEHRANCVLCVLPNLMTRLALDENLLARSRILGIPRDDREDSGSEHDNETAHPTLSMADKEYTRANRSDDLADRLPVPKRFNRSEGYCRKTRSGKSVALHEDTVGRLAQRADDFPISCFRKRFQRVISDVSQHAQL